VVSLRYEEPTRSSEASYDEQATEWLWEISEEGFRSKSAGKNGLDTRERP
jgi:hypothetical protein